MVEDAVGISRILHADATTRTDLGRRERRRRRIGAGGPLYEYCQNLPFPIHELGEHWQSKDGSLWRV